MKRVTVKLFGTVTHGATREFVLQYSPEVDPQLISPAMLEELADQAQIPWVHLLFVSRGRQQMFGIFAMGNTA